MRTKSDIPIYILGFLLMAAFFVLGLKIAPTASFAEDNEEEVEYVVPSGERFVTVFDNGNKTTIKTNASTVAEVLNRLEVVLDESDSVSPSLDTVLDSDLYYINIYRSRPVVIIDKTVQKIANVTSYNPKTAVRSAGFEVYDDDEIEIVTTTNFLETGVSLAYKIIRGNGTTVTVEEDVEYETETIRDYDIPTGSEEVRQIGELGKVKKVYKVKSIHGEEMERELVSTEMIREPVTRIVAVGTAIKDAKPLTASMGRNHYTAKNLSGEYVEREETYYDLNMSGVMGFCGKSSYSVREDGAKVDDDGYVIVAAALDRYPRCSIVETSLGLGKVYDTGSFVSTRPENFDLATDWGPVGAYNGV